MSTMKPPADSHYWSDPSLAAEQPPALDEAAPRSLSGEDLDKVRFLDHAYEQYYRLVAAGEPVDPVEYCNRFPNYRTSLRRLLGVDEAIEEHPSLLRRIDFLWPEAGQQLDDLKLVRLLGRGSFARVYLALETTAGDRPIVVKLSPESPREAQTLGPLDHPGVVPILHARETEVGLTELRMPFRGSATLLDVLDRAYPTARSRPPASARVILDAARSAIRPGDPEPARQQAPEAILEHGSWIDGVVHLGIRLAEALAFLRDRGIGHRDLKPSNVLLSPSGAPLLLDFNLSTEVRCTNPCRGGTLPYMAPEQIRSWLSMLDGESVDDRADLWSLGVILYELLTGAHPFRSVQIGAGSRGVTREKAELMLERLEGGFVPLRRLNPDVPEEVARLIESCLSCDPARRPESAAALAAGLRRHFAPVRRVGRWAARHKVLLAALGVLLLTAGTVGAAALAARDPLPVREYQAGLQAYRAGRYAEAEAHFRRARDERPEQLEYWLALARSQALQVAATNRDPRMYEAAVSTLMGAAERFGRAAAVEADFCWLLGRKGQYAGAILSGEQALKRGYRSAALLNNLAYARIQHQPTAQTYFQALAELDEAIAAAPDLQAARWNRALLQYCFYKTNRQGRRPNKVLVLPQQALIDIQVALGLGEATHALHFDAACIAAVSQLCLQERRALVLAHLEKAVELGWPASRLAFEPDFAFLKTDPKFLALQKHRPEVPPTKLVTRLQAPGTEALP